MIELNNLILNATASSDLQTVQMNAEELPDVELSLDGQEGDDDQNLDLGSFVMLMAQVLANSQLLTDSNATTTEPEATVATTTTEDTANNSINLLTAQSNTAEETSLDLDNNIAMTWINSESYTPPQINTDASELSDTVEIEQLEPAPELIPKAIAKAIGLFTDPNQLGLDADLQTMQPNLGAQELGVLNLKNIPLDSSQPEVSATNTQLNAIMSSPMSNTDPAMANILVNASNLTADTKIKPDSSTENNVNLVQSAFANTPFDLQATKTSANAQTLSIQQEVTNPQWGDKFAEHIVWMGQQGVKSALIKIHPEELGPIEINIKMVKDTATVSISSHSSHVCNIVDQSLPKLRDLMANQGLTLAEVNINSDGKSQGSPQQNNFNQGIANPTEDEVLLTPLNRKPTKGLIDYFA